jgi:hypothetical protein
MRHRFWLWTMPARCLFHWTGPRRLLLILMPCPLERARVSYCYRLQQHAMSPMVKTAVVLFNVLHELSKLAVHLHGTISHPPRQSVDGCPRIDAPRAFLRQKYPGLRRKEEYGRMGLGRPNGQRQVSSLSHCPVDLSLLLLVNLGSCNGASATATPPSSSSLSSHGLAQGTVACFILPSPACFSSK